MAKFTDAERIRMLMAAFEFCPACQKQFLEYAAGNGLNPIRFMRELLWKLWGHWEHGEECPQTAQPEALARAAQVSTEPLRHGPDALSAVALGAVPGAGILSNQEPSMVLLDPEAGSLV